MNLDRPDSRRERERERERERHARRAKAVCSCVHVYMSGSLAFVNNTCVHFTIYDSKLIHVCTFIFLSNTYVYMLLFMCVVRARYFYFIGKWNRNNEKSNFLFKQKFGQTRIMWGLSCVCMCMCVCVWCVCVPSEVQALQKLFSSASTLETLLECRPEDLLKCTHLKEVHTLEWSAHTSLEVHTLQKGFKKAFGVAGCILTRV